MEDWGVVDSCLPNLLKMYPYFLLYNMYRGFHAKYSTYTVGKTVILEAAGYKQVILSWPKKNEPLHRLISYKCLKIKGSILL